jgi:hypothetical protein
MNGASYFCGCKCASVTLVETEIPCRFRTHDRSSKVPLDLSWLTTYLVEGRFVSLPQHKDGQESELTARAISHLEVHALQLSQCTSACAVCGLQRIAREAAAAAPQFLCGWLLLLPTHCNIARPDDQ